MIKNYEILYQQIKNMIINSELDIGAVYFILKNIFIEIEAMYYQQVKIEIQQQEQGEE